MILEIKVPINLKCVKRFSDFRDKSSDQLKMGEEV